MTQWSALLITIAIEVPIVLVWMWRADPGAFDWKRIAAVSAAATLLTHPLVWHTNVALVAWPFALRAALVETFAVVAETVVYRKFVPVTWRRAAALSLAANAASFGAGLLIWALR